MGQFECKCGQYVHKDTLDVHKVEVRTTLEVHIGDWLNARVARTQHIQSGLCTK